MGKQKTIVVNTAHLDKISAALEKELGIDEIKRPYKIVSANIRDGFCDYGYEVVEGIGLGDKHPKVKGAGLFKEDMGYAFGRLHVHLACIDDVFKHSNTEITDIDKLHADDLTFLYNVTGIKLSGSDDNVTVVLTGSKFINCAGGRITITTPQIPIGELSSYLWHNELREIVETICEEVALYKEGKCTLPDSDDEFEESHKVKGKRIAKQLEITSDLGDKDDAESDVPETDFTPEEESNEDERLDLENNRV